MTRIHVPSQLRGYTGGRTDVEATGATLGDVLADLDRQFPGFQSRVIDDHGRVRPYIVLFVGADRRDDLATPVPSGAEVMIVGALSGG